MAYATRELFFKPTLLGEISFNQFPSASGVNFDFQIHPYRKGSGLPKSSNRSHKMELRKW
ncbi:MAG: hypothetical protein CMB26_01405 [Euryarchaeota archaeon]|nr:hypothetical protein [Euryarchaeota archaeon]